MRQKAMYVLAAMVAAAAMFAVGAPLRAAETDDTIESSFEKTYVYEKFLKDDSIRIEAKDGVVTLTGTVVEESHKLLAQETAANLPGVARVDNKLETRIEAGTENADAWVGRKVKLTLFFHRHINYGKTTVAVKDGVVTLKGEASTEAQKDLTAEYAKDIEGVKEVKNEMTVAAVPDLAERTEVEKMDDASIIAQVKTALATHRSTGSLMTKVEARNGEVTLTGIAKSETEKVLVTKLVTDIRGVSRVNNLMTIDAVKTK